MFLCLFRWWTISCMAVVRSLTAPSTAFSRSLEWSWCASLALWESSLGPLSESGTVWNQTYHSAASVIKWRQNKNLHNVRICIYSYIEVPPPSVTEFTNNVNSVIETLHTLNNGFVCNRQADEYPSITAAFLQRCERTEASADGWGSDNRLQRALCGCKSASVTETLEFRSKTRSLKDSSLFRVAFISTKVASVLSWTLLMFSCIDRRRWMQEPSSYRKLFPFWQTTQRTVYQSASGWPSTGPSLLL